MRYSRKLILIFAIKGQIYARVEKDSENDFIFSYGQIGTSKPYQLYYKEYKNARKQFNEYKKTFLNTLNATNK